MINSDGILDSAIYIESPFYNQRPQGTEINLLVIHCISLPEGQFGTEHIQNLFTGKLDCCADPSFACLQGLEVSAHCVIRRDGIVEQYVPFHERAWHAGVSSFEGREGCNDFSIGIELEGTDCSEYTDLQYQALVNTTQQIQVNYPSITLPRIVGHSDIAPGRKTDPGSGFDWERYFSKLA
ncbi:1,6-anhydro-N-acetylmuramyl-L-alanine amidase AmpD [Psychromonas algicola]|uniref:1,6-anhydro-N-acetylmuramyl-L-alanine amidase AmpD n=1 Tax=Psychromonas algicola TaxID=2555642 RepID=UPI0010685B3C|nr:1,6-anhydro-N-acetylmuramyl-L-alanine amidase AmpD [Psychromonas sp. RZ5]TEW51390.1 1,6-anhydro-N-acetylmuramyl-L-alanine amidase AmpD [Psychromonas sp. RZ5]